MTAAEDETPFARSAALLGEAAFARLRSLKVAIVGVGGVGGWCAEALARSGVGELLLMDDDTVKPSNLNRQACASVAALGRPKVEAMAEHLQRVAPDCRVRRLSRRFLPTDSVAVLGECDVIVDAIDSVDSKCALLAAAEAAEVPVFSSLGAARRFDPSQVELRQFRKVEGDALARAMRQRFKKTGVAVAGKWQCAVSREAAADCEGLGSLMPVVAAAGNLLAAAVIGTVREFEGKAKGQ